MQPKLALMLAQVLSAAAVMAALLTVFLYSVVWPEYCSDVVRRGTTWDRGCVLHIALRTPACDSGKGLRSPTLRVPAFCSALARLCLPFTCCAPQIYAGHHEGLEHLTHLAHHVLGSRVRNRFVV